MATAKAIAPFMWGPGGEKLTKAQLDRKRAVADALRAPQGYTPKGVWSLLGGLAGEGTAAIKDNQFDAVEQDKQKLIAEALAGGKFQDVMANDFATPQQSSVAAALQGRQWDAADRAEERAYDAPLRDLQLQQAQLNLEQDRNPAPKFQMLTPDEVTAAGLPPGSYQRGADGKIDPIGTGSGITINTGDNSGAFDKKADEIAAVRLGDVVTGGQDAAQFAGDLQTLAALAPQIETGKTAEIMTALGPYAEAMGIDIKNLGEMQAYQSIIDKLSPQMRPAGSGAASDFDARQFLSSLPSLGRTPEGNQIITQTLSALQQHKMAAAEIAGLAFTPKDQGGITWQEAEKRIREMPNPYQGFNEYAKTATGKNEAKKITSQEEYDALPSGALFVDPDDGNTYRKP